MPMHLQIGIALYNVQLYIHRQYIYLSAYSTTQMDWGSWIVYFLWRSCWILLSGDLSMSGNLTWNDSIFNNYEHSIIGNLIQETWWINIPISINVIVWLLLSRLWVTYKRFCYNNWYHFASDDSDDERMMMWRWHWPGWDWDEIRGLLGIQWSAQYLGTWHKTSSISSPEIQIDTLSIHYETEHTQFCCNEWILYHT